MAETLQSNPVALSEMLLAVDFYLDTPKQVLVVAPQGKRADAAPLLEAFRRQFLPNRIFLFVTEGEDLLRCARTVPLLEGKEATGGQVTAFVCENRVCRLPTSDPAEFAEQLRTGKTGPR
jgi:uncharacterized protein YyaL (SSP411 family)